MQGDGTAHFPFAFRIRYIRAELPPHIPHESVFSVGNHFRPPTNPAHFSEFPIDYRWNGGTCKQSQIFAWEPGMVKTLAPHQSRLWRNYRSTSLFWCSDRGGYFVLPFDCTSADRTVAPYSDHGANLDDSDEEGTATPNVSDLEVLDSQDIPISWRRLTFGRDQHDGAFSKVGYYQEYYRLGARVPERWSNQLIPPTQSRQNTGGSTNHTGFQQPRCKIAGDLGTLLGLCAFGSEVENTPATIMHSFRPDNGNPAYRRPPSAVPFHERTDDRGVIVDIYEDGQQQRRENLHKWENGYYGPILT